MVPLQTVVAEIEGAVEAVEAALEQYELGGHAVWFDKMAGLVGRHVEQRDIHSAQEHWSVGH